MNRSGVYQIVNRITGECYVGSSVNMTARWSKHKSNMRHNSGANPNLLRAWTQYGEGALKMEVLAYIPDREQLKHVEQQLINKLRPVYNRSPSAYSNRGMRHTKEAKANIGASVSGEKNVWYGKVPPCVGGSSRPEVRKRMSEARKGRRNPMFGVRGPMSKLSDDSVREIKKALVAGERSDVLAEMYGVSIGAIQHIKKGRTYRDVLI